MKSISELSGRLRDVRVLVRVDFNLPIEDGEILDDWRIERILPTIQFLKKEGAKISLVSHIESSETDSLDIVSKHLEKYFHHVFAGLPLGREAVEKTRINNSGEILLFENLRLYDGERKNDSEFAKELSKLGDIFINEAFSVSHRTHASIVGIPKNLPSYVGFLFEEEIKNLSLAFKPKHPFIFILGGAKFETKLPLVERFLSIADHIFVGGALANDAFKAKGLEIGHSKTSESAIDMNVIDNEKILLPKDVYVEDENKKTAVKKSFEVKKNERIIDAGPETLSMLEKIIQESHLCVWNGPLGKYEEGYGKTSELLADVIAKTKIHSVIGGGDTIAIIRKKQIENKFTFVSTGGGAMLDFLSKGTLPGIEAIHSY